MRRCPVFLRVFAVNLRIYCCRTLLSCFDAVRAYNHTRDPTRLCFLFSQLRIERNTQQTQPEQDAEEIDDDLPVGETCL